MQTSTTAPTIQVSAVRYPYRASGERYTVTVQTMSDDTATARVTMAAIAGVPISGQVPGSTYSISETRSDPRLLHGQRHTTYRVVRLLAPVSAAPSWRAYTQPGADDITPAEAIRAYLDSNTVW